MNTRTQLRRHALARDTRGVIARRQQLECELTAAVRGSLVVNAIRVVYQSNGCAGDSIAGGIKNRASDGPSRTVLAKTGKRKCDEQNKTAGATPHGFTPTRSEPSLDGRRLSYSTSEEIRQ